MGFSLDWDRYVFTLDPGYSASVTEAFVRLFHEGLIYRGKRMVNWCPRDGSAISDLEVEYVEMDTSLWYVRYAGADGSPGIVIATQRPETIMADVAVGVHPDDDRYRRLVGTHVLVPIVNRRVPVIADARVDPQFGTGALKITPGHALVDHEIGADHGLPVLVVLDPKGRMTLETGKYAGMDRFRSDRYRRLVGTHVLVPIVNRRVPVIADARVDPQFGTGALKITPGHALVDHEIGADHGLPVLVVLDPKGRMTLETGKYAGMDRF